MVRRFLSVILGFVIAIVTFSVAEWFGRLIYPTPEKFDGNDINAIREFISRLPVGAFLIVAFGWILGSFFAGFAEKTISREPGLLLPAIIGILLTTAAAINFLIIPQPRWFVVLGLLIFVPAAVLGHLAAPVKQRRF